MSGTESEAGSVAKANKPFANYWFKNGSYLALLALAFFLPPIAIAIVHIPSSGFGLLFGIGMIWLMSVFATGTGFLLGPVALGFVLYRLFRTLIWGLEPSALYGLCCTRSGDGDGLMVTLFSLALPGSVVSSYFCFHFLFRRRQADFREALWLTLGAVLISAFYAGYSLYLEQTLKCDLVRCNL